MSRVQLPATHLAPTSGKPAARLILALLVALPSSVVLLLTGCVSVGAYQQRLVSKPNMVFGDSPAFNYQSKLVVQTEPGTALTGGAQAAGCTSCK